MRTEDQEVYFLSYLPKAEVDAAEREGRMWNEDAYAYLAVTDSHLFYMALDHYLDSDPGWLPVYSLRGGHEIETADGESVIVNDKNVILRTANGEVGWEQGLLVPMRDV
ncbi:hypothetical protein [Chitinimonas koreensis]|uniref:hypothetical protein n=1 Tax=Chitinimonas koreensis TaxID=356302 RepID=UPI001654BD23|nr:hypothetical protein [Chitinimonas koreensis]QNM98755.1 hypothetical protein H9L41_11380 [Chitinimonas koreensis]